jgi:LPS sulfotransferase NodH
MGETDGATGIDPADGARPPSTSYLVCSSARSGSSLLCDYLTSTGVAGRPDEYFSRARPGGALQDPEWLKSRDALAPMAYLEELVRLGSTPNGVFGAKITTTTLVDLLSLLREAFEDRPLTDAELLARAFPGLRLVFTTRRDKIRQAVSLLRVLQTRQFSLREPAATPDQAGARYSFPLVEMFVNDLVAGERDWEELFSQWHNHPHTVVYEDLAARPDETVRGVLSFLGVDEAAAIVPQTSLRPQSDAVSAAWAERHHRRKHTLHRLLLAAGLPAVLRNRNLTWYFLTRRFRPGRRAP